MSNIILTGASDGLGKEFGKVCEKNNINIIALCRTKPDYNCEFIKTDLTDKESIINACRTIKDKYSKFDALINCAGVPGIQRLEEVTYDCVEDLMKINSIAPMVLTANLMNLIKENEADIINVGN